MKEAQANTAVINAPSRRLFRPMFRARLATLMDQLAPVYCSTSAS